MIISTVKSQPDGINVRGILLKRSCHTHLKHFKPYKFILQKAKKPPKRLLFAPSIILIVGGLFLHKISRILKANLKCLRVPTTDSERKNHNQEEE